MSEQERVEQQKNGAFMIDLNEKGEEEEKHGQNGAMANGNGKANGLSMEIQNTMGDAEIELKSIKEKSNVNQIYGK